MKKTLIIAVLGAVAGLALVAPAQGTTTTFDDTNKTNMNIPSGSVEGDLIIFNITDSGNNSGGYFNAAKAYTFNGSVQIGDGASTSKGLVIYDGYGETSATFEGSLSGNGVIQRGGNNKSTTLTLNFNGDTSAFTGNIEFVESGASSGATIMQFGDGTHASGLGTADGGFTAGGKTITMTGSNADDKIIFNYGNGAADASVVTATIAHNISGTNSNIELKGDAHMVFTGRTRIDTLTIGADVAGVTYNCSGAASNYSEIWNISKEGGSGVEINKTGSGYLVLKNAAATIETATVSEGHLTTYGTTTYTEMKDIIVKDSGHFSSWNNSDVTTLNAKVTTQGTTQATFEAKAPGGNWTIQNFVIAKDRITNMGDGSIAIGDAAVTFHSGKYYVGNAVFTNSVVTVQNGAILEAFGTATRTTFDSLVVEAGGSLRRAAGSGSTESLTYGGDVSLTLAALSGADGVFSTNVLPGKMTEDSVLTFSFTDTLLNGTLDGLDTFTLTLTDLSAATGATLTDSNFKYEGWNVSIVDPAASSIQLRFTSVPEPATATLSLLALAGLAARRRRK